MSSIMRRSREDLAEIIAEMGYNEMRDFADMLVNSVMADREDGKRPNVNSAEWWCEKLRWIAASILDAKEDREAK